MKASPIDYLKQKQKINNLCNLKILQSNMFQINLQMICLRDFAHQQKHEQQQPTNDYI